MQYTQLGNTGLKVSRFGLGCMRFAKDDAGVIDEARAIEMVRYAIDHGVNYIDTAYLYEGSEYVLSKALKDGYRERINLVSKCPLWGVESHADFEKYLDLSLERLGVEYLDIYLMHNLFEANWDKVKRFDGFSFLDEMLKKGKIRHQGFSIHNTFEGFKEVANAFPWEVAQIQLNILDEHTQAGLEGLKYGADKGFAMVIMEPLRGGSLAQNIPAEVQELLDNFPEKRSFVEWCFRWLYDKPEVSTVLSGTTTLEQLKDNLRIFDSAQTDVLTSQEQEVIAQIRDIYQSKQTIGCTGCGYCMPCPQDVSIPDCFRLYNNYMLNTGVFSERMVYVDALMPRGKAADRCIDCGACESMCPQSLPIPKLFQEVQAVLGAPIPNFFEEGEGSIK